MMSCNKGETKLNNRGVTFVELVVVIAILAVMAASMAYGVSLLINADAKKASKNMYSQISDLRNQTLSQTGTWYGEIKRESAKGQYVFTTYRVDNEGNTNQVSRETLGSKITITAKGSGEMVITDTDSVLIYFNAGTGTVKNVKSGVTGAELRSSTSNKFCFAITSDSEITYELTLWTNTGKISTDY